MDVQGFLCGTEVRGDAESMPRVYGAIREDNVGAVDSFATIELICLHHCRNDVCWEDAENEQAHVRVVEEGNPSREKLSTLCVGGLEVSKLSACLVRPLPS